MSAACVHGVCCAHTCACPNTATPCSHTFFNLARVRTRRHVALNTMQLWPAWVYNCHLFAVQHGRHVCNELHCGHALHSVARLYTCTHARNVHNYLLRAQSSAYTWKYQLAYLLSLTGKSPSRPLIPRRG